MVKLNIARARDLLQNFDFKTLFVEELGWSQPTNLRCEGWQFNDIQFERRQIAQLAGVVIFEITSSNDSIPDAKTRAACHKEISRLYHENVLVFIGQQRYQSLWYYTKREGAKKYPRDHFYFKGQPGDLFLSKLSAIVFDLSELDEQGNLSVVEVARRLRNALDVEPVAKKFYEDFKQERLAFLELIEGIDNPRDRQWYASILLNRLMFVYFLQRKGMINDGDTSYLQNHLEKSRNEKRDCYFRNFLKTLFFQGFAKPEHERDKEVNALLGKIKYLNSSLFLEHRIEVEHGIKTDRFKIQIPDQAFDNLYKLFKRYSWNLDDTPGGQDDEISPHTLGYIFEKYINQKAFGAYYTRPEITEYLCERTIHELILNRINALSESQTPTARRFDSVADMLLHLDAQSCRKLVTEVLPKLSILDPACGSGAFLIAAMKTLINIYSAVIGRIKFLSDPFLTQWLQKIEVEHPNIAYPIRRRIITENLFGVDIVEEATEIARLRMFLALVAPAKTIEELRPLPNIDANILAGNSLIGLMRVDDQEFNRRHAQGNLFIKSYPQILKEKNELTATYLHSNCYGEKLRALRDKIAEKKKEAHATLNEILLEDFAQLGVKFEEATWDDSKNKEGKPKKRPLEILDIEALHPFHWGYEFDEILHQRGGFDVIITNPPWEVFQTDEKEFFQQFLPTIQKNKLRIEDWKKQQTKLMKDEALRKAWLDYASRFPFVSKYLKSSSQFKNQISILKGKNVGSKINLYSYFVEQCFNLLRSGGECGIVIPSGIYTDLGAKQLREMLFDQTELTGLFGFENRKEIFENVHRSFKFVVLTLKKGGNTRIFPAAFMRHEVEELKHFPKEGGLQLSVELIRRLSPDSLSVMEFKNEMDVHIAEKMARFPFLGEKFEDRWNLSLSTEFNMTTDSALFKTKAGSGRLPLYEGKMIHQFDHLFSEPRYWVDEKEGRRAVLGRGVVEEGQVLGYQKLRIGVRSIGRSTDSRTLIVGPIPQNVFCGNSILVLDRDTESSNYLSDSEVVFILSVLNSFVVDFYIRQMVSANLNMFYIYQLPVPRLSENDSEFAPIVNRAAKLICTTPEFDDLAKEVGLGSHKKGVIDPAERARLRAELDGMVAHLYGLTEEEFSYILTTFPLVEQSVKDAALAAYRALAQNVVDQKTDEKSATYVKKPMVKAPPVVKTRKKVAVG